MTVSTNPTSPPQSPFCSSPRELFNDTLSPPIRSPAFASSSMDLRTSNKPPKKKAGFLSSLFAKEPSAQAFADYQKLLLKQGQGRPNTVGLSGVSSAKLPPTVPKVNSRWDGVPETVKEKEKLKQGHKQSMSGHSRDVSVATSIVLESRPSSTSHSQKRLSHGTMGGLSTHSNSSTNRLADLYGWEGNPISSSSSAIVDFAAEHRPGTARMQTSHSAPPAPESRPPLERTSLFPPHDPHHPSANWHPSLEGSSLSRSASPNLPSYSHSPALTPLDSSPATPEGPHKSLNFPSPLSDIKPEDNIRTTIIDVPAPAEEVIIKSAGPNILGPPATAKRRHKASPDESGSDRPSTSGVDMQLTSILKKGTPKETPSRPALSSYFPSPDSASPVVPRRNNSARERLGLGVSVKNQDVAPWYSPEDADNVVEGERMITPTPEGGQSLRRKNRMSLFKK